jgi:septal ring factor EnvC (AmiA/AmiB activator)
MNKLACILIVTLAIIAGLMLCYFVLKVPVIVNTLNAFVPSILKQPGATITTTLASVTAASAIAIPIYSKMKSTATAATTQLQTTKTQLSTVESKVNNLDVANTGLETQLTQVTTLKDSALSQIEQQKTTLQQLTAEKDAAIAQANSLQKKLEEQPIKIVKVPV